jgi:predicted membrane GTPase involved in stress response
VPADLAGYGFEADYVEPDSWETQAGLAALKQRFGIGEALISSYNHPYVYLNRELIAAEGLDQAEVEAAVAEEIVKFEGVALAVSSTALARGQTPGSLEAQEVHRRIHTVDVAPTLSAIVGIKPPSGSRGHVLTEVLASR